MWKWIFILCFLNFVCGEFEITDEQYYQMPKLFDLDDYTECMSQDDAAYCVGTFELVPNGRANEYIYYRMTEYSKGSFTYNHTLLHRGFCMKARCPEQMNTKNLEDIFPSCVDNYTRSTYGFSAKLKLLNYCRNRTYEKAVDPPENWFYFVVKCLIALNIFGTFYDVFTTNEKANPYILTWSIRSNWKHLTDKNIYGNLTSFESLQFIRVLGSAFVVLGHVILTIFRSYLNNPRDLEYISRLPVSMILHNGSTVVQMFTLLSNFFLTYKIRHEAEVQEHFGINMLPKLVLKRLTRILPSYWLAVAFASTMWPRISNGPLWPLLVEEESHICRDIWLSQATLVSNLNNIKDRCLPQTWSLAADIQLYVASASIALLLGRSKHALKVLITLFVCSVLLVFGVSYTFSLKTMMMVANPEIMRTVYKYENSISFLYISPWASAPSCLLGMVLAHIIYNIRKQKAERMKKDDVKLATPEPRRATGIKFIVFRSLIFVIFGWILTGNYVNGHASPLFVSVYTALERPVFALLVGGIIYGGLNKIDNLWLDMGSWSGWRIPGRLSLWVVLMHWPIAVAHVASRTQLTHFSVHHVAIEVFTILIETYALALPLTLMVELPAQRFLQKIFSL